MEVETDLNSITDEDQLRKMVSFCNYKLTKKDFYFHLERDRRLFVSKS